MKKIKTFISPFGHIKYAIVTSQKQLECLIQQEGWNRAYPTFYQERVGCVDYMENSTGMSYVVIHMAITRKSGDFFYASVAHEATHLWQFIRKEMYEHEPSIEFEAYSIQLIVEHILSRV